MSYKDALELLNMFILATQNAKSKNKVDLDYKIDESMLVEFLKKAYPNQKDSSEILKLAKSIL